MSRLHQSTRRKTHAYLAAVQDVQRALAADVTHRAAARLSARARSRAPRCRLGAPLRSPPPDVAVPDAALLARATRCASSGCACPFAERPELRLAPFTPALGSLWAAPPHDVRSTHRHVAGGEWIARFAAKVVNNSTREFVPRYADWRAEHVASPACACGPSMTAHASRGALARAGRLRGARPQRRGAAGRDALGSSTIERALGSASPLTSALCARLALV